MREDENSVVIEMMGDSKFSEELHDSIMFRRVFASLSEVLLTLRRVPVKFFKVASRREDLIYVMYEPI